MSTKIKSLELENVKRVKAVELQPTIEGLTVIGGNNGQGKTSVLDAIAWALGGERFAPSSPQREGSVVPPRLRVELSNGIVVERSGKNSSLKVIDTNGNKGGQALLNEFITQFALDLPKFMNSSGKEKANILLRIIGVGDKLYELENKEESLYNERRLVGQIADQKKKHALELPEYEGAPSELVSASELIRRQQEILAKNGENQRLREKKERCEYELTRAQNEYERAKKALDEAQKNYDIATSNTKGLVDDSTVQIERDIADIESINQKVRANLLKSKAEDEAKVYSDKYTALTDEIERVRAEKYDLLNGAELPLEGLSVEGKELTYKGFKWDNMSGSEQLKVATAIIRKLNPNCGFVLLDKLEQMDMNTLNEFNAWLVGEGLQAIATRVSTGEECSIIIEDGYSAAPEFKKKEWKAGQF